MDEFKLLISIDKFRSTNAAWNDLMLNDPYSVGYVSQLIESKEWSSKEEWEQFYYDSGEERNKLLGVNRSILNNDSLQLTHKHAIQSLTWQQKNLNYQYGRTKEDLMNKAKKLNAVAKNLTLDECYECVRFRTICETWNGIIVRETNTIKTLSSLFPTYEFRKTDGNIDHTYAVDYEVYCNGVLKCGIQIKPQSYTFNAPYLQKARFANQQKYDAYRRLKGVCVYVVISKGNGQIINNDVIVKLRTL
jgi:hypothetical protein